MSQFSKYLTTRIDELNESIEAQKAQLAAYERVLHLENTKGSESASSAKIHDETPTQPKNSGSS